MIWWIVIIFAIGCGIWWAKETYSIGSGVGVGFLVLLLGVILAFLLCLLIGAAEPPYAEPYTVQTTEIRALRDGTDIEGRFGGGIFCTSGYIDEEPVYTVLVNTDRGMKTEVYKAKNTYIQFTDEAPRVETCVCEAIGFWNFFCGDGILDTLEYIIYIPTDSEVVCDYVIDLE